MKKLFLTLLVITLFQNNTTAQKNKKTWEVGVGAALTKFSDSDASYIGDRYSFKTPRLNITMPLTEKISLDGALSFNTFDIGIIKNSAKYTSLDLSARYNFDALFNKFYPYAFAGGSFIDSERKATPTFNVGAGATYWFNEKWG